MKYFRIFVLASLALSGCGKKEEKKDFSGLLGSCKNATLTTFTTCTEYTYAVKATEDPKSAAIQELQTACEADSGTWSLTETCETAGAHGKCVSTATNGGASITVSLISSGASITPELAEAACASSNGTFTAF